jgi:beta-xylosidase
MTFAEDDTVGGHAQPKPSGSATAASPLGADGPFGHPWIPNPDRVTFRNPIIYADYSDPDVVRVGDDYYLTASSFNCTPGLPLLHSRNLVNWTLIGHAVENLPHPRYFEVQPGCGIWAPAIRFHQGRFWIFFPMPDEGIYVTTAEHPAGPWTEPHLLQAGRGLIDPCPLWDDDGRAYLVHAYAGSRAGIKHRLLVCAMAPDGSRLLDDGTIVFHEPTRHPTIEGPKFLKKDGWYYILAPAGGVEQGWQVALRSRDIHGPYSERIVLEQGRTGTNGPHQGALIDTPEGQWWFLHFQDAGVYGRIVHLQPVQWQDGWPLMGQIVDGRCEPVSHHPMPISMPSAMTVPQTSDEFETGRLGPQWQWHANHRPGWYDAGARPGWLRLYPQISSQPTLERVPNLLLQKFPARTFTVDLALDFAPREAGEEAGLVVAGQSCGALALESTASGNRLVLCLDGARKVVGANLPASIRLRAAVADGGLCRFGFATGGEFVAVEPPFQAVKGVWIGAKIGVYSLKRADNAAAGHVDIDYFRFNRLE